MLLLHLKRVLFFGLLGLIAATAWILLSKKVYEAKLVLQVGGSSRSNPDPVIPDDVERIIDKVESQQPATEVDILRQENLFVQSLQTLNNPQMLDDWKSYFKMYNVLGGPSVPDANPSTVSGIAILQVRAYEPKTAIDLAEAIGRTYSGIRQDNLRKANATAENYLTEQIGSYSDRLKVLDREYQKAQDQAKMPDIMMTTQKREEQMSLLQSKRDSIESDLRGAQSELAELKRQYAEIQPNMAGLHTDVRNPVIEAIDQQLAQLESQRAAKAQTFNDNAVEVKQLDRAIEKLQQRKSEALAKGSVPQTNETQPNMIRETVRGQIATSASRVASDQSQLGIIDRQFQEKVATVDAIPAAVLKLTEIDRSRKVAETKFETLTMAHSIIENRVKAATSPVLVVSDPQIDFVKEPVEPNIPRTILIGLLAGLSIGAIFTVARESVKPVVFSATQLEQTTGLPVVATIPKLPGGEVQRVRTLLNSSRFPRKNFHDMASVVLAERETLPKTVVVCGVDGEASSSMAAVSYAAALARAGLRVTLVDANPAKILTRVFEMEADNGIVDYLTQAALISQKALAQFSMLTKHNEQLGCRICAYGTADTASLTDFSDDRVAGIIEALKPDCDVLVIETAPSGRLPDAVRMARHADEVLATFESGTSSDRSVETLRDLFAEAGVKKMSMVLTSTLERVA